MYHFPGNGTIKKQVGSRRNLNLLRRLTLQHIEVCFRVPWCISLNLPMDCITSSPVLSIATRLLDICKCIRLLFLVLYLPLFVLMSDEGTEPVADLAISKMGSKHTVVWHTDRGLHRIQPCPSDSDWQDPWCFIKKIATQPCIITIHKCTIS